MRLLLAAFLILNLSGCEVAKLLAPSDPCSQLFDTTYAQMECRVEQGIQLEADLITAKAKATLPGDRLGKAKLQKRLDNLKQLRTDQRTAASLFSEGKIPDAETQLELLIKTLEAAQ